MAVFRFCFASFCFEVKMIAVFCFFYVLFSLRSIFVSLQIFTFASMQNKRKKHFFSHRSKKNFTSDSLHFASKQKWRRTLSTELSPVPNSACPPTATALCSCTFCSFCPFSLVDPLSALPRICERVTQEARILVGKFIVSILKLLTVGLERSTGISSMNVNSNTVMFHTDVL